MGKRRKEKKRKNTCYKLSGILLMISSILLLGVVLTSMFDILPLKYLSGLIGGLFLINLIVNFFLFRKKIKKKPKKFFSFVALLFSVLFIAASFFIYKTFGVLDNMTEEYKTYKYHVLVKNNSNYQDIKDIESKSLGYYNDNSTATKKALSTLREKFVNTDNESYGNLESLGSDLLDGSVESILVEDSQKIKLDNAGNSTKENNLIKDFTNKTRVLKTFTVKIKLASDKTDVTKDVFNIYISGMDEYGKVASVSRSDVNMIITVNPKTRQILLTNIPRDYYVQLHDTTGYKDKLTHAGNYGIDTSVATIEDLLGIKINYYVKVNFSSLVNIVNALGGVEVYSEYDFQSWNGYNFSKGYNKVNGKEALSFVRERKTFNEGDNQRGKNQQAMIEAIFRKCTSPGIIVKYNSLLNSLEDSMITDMPMKSIKKLAKMQLVNNEKWTITSNSLSGTGSSEYTYTYPYQALYVTVADEESIKLSKELISKVTEGEILESSYDGDSNNVHSVTKSEVYKQSVTTTKSTTKSKKTTSSDKRVTDKNDNKNQNITDNQVVDQNTSQTQAADEPSSNSDAPEDNTGNNTGGSGGTDTSTNVDTSKITGSIEGAINGD